MTELQEYVLNISMAAASVAAMDINDDNELIAEIINKTIMNDGKHLSDKMINLVNVAINEAFVRIDRISEEEALTLIQSDKIMYKKILKTQRKMKKSKQPKMYNGYKPILKGFVLEYNPICTFQNCEQKSY